MDKRPIRYAYYHERCQSITEMPAPAAETFARNPSFYGAVDCKKCFGSFDVDEFLWVQDGKVIDEKVGS
jgi:hypothetical protein